MIGNAIRMLLRPAVIIALRHGLKIQDLIDYLKISFIELSKDELKNSAQKLSISKIAIMSGLSRREVLRFSDGEPNQATTPKLLSKVIGQWQLDKRYSSKGTPKPLSYEGMQSEFFSLVSSVSKDLNPYTVLFELERIGNVTRTDGLVELKTKSLNAQRDVEKGWLLLAEDSFDLIEAVQENLSNPKSLPNLHITTRYDNLLTGALPQIKEWILKKGAEFHASAREYISQYDKDLNPTLYKDEGGGSIVLGSFSRISGEERKESKDINRAAS